MGSTGIGVDGGGEMIAFFDVESSVPTRPGQGFAILEFGSILVCPRKLVEVDSYSTLVRPADLSLISSLSVRRSGITRDAVLSAPTFSEIADTVFDILEGRIWAGHNIVRFDCARIREAFAQIDRPSPQPKGTIDSLALLTHKFGRRAGDMKMASIATYFGLGQQTHRSLDDVRMNLEVLKYCATVLFLESSLPDIFTANCWVSPNVTTRSRSNGKASPKGTGLITTKPSLSSQIKNQPTSSPPEQTIEEYHPILSLMVPGTGECVSDLVEPNIAPPDPFSMASLSTELEKESLQPDNTERESGSVLLNSAAANSSEASVECTDFLKLDKVSIPSITAVLAPIYRGIQRVQIFHENTVLQICHRNLKVRFGISAKFVDYAGRPRLNFVANASPDLCQVLDKCNSIAQSKSLDSGSTSEWRPVVNRKAGYENSPTIRFHIPMVTYGDSARWSTEMYLKESSTEKVVFSRYDVEELEALLAPGTIIDAYFSLDPYDYQHNAGIRLVANKLIVHPN